jgi:hypothetical protein
VPQEAEVYPACPVKQLRYKAWFLPQAGFNWVKIAMQWQARSTFNWDGVIVVLVKNLGGI